MCPIIKKFFLNYLDLFSGINVEVYDSKEGDGKSQIITQLNKVYVDKYTKKQYKGSKYNSKVEIITEDKKIKMLNLNLI